MALGVGAAVFTGYGVAWADDNPSSDAGPKATNQHSGSGSSASQNGSRAKKTKASGSSNSVSSEGNSAQADKVDNTVRANTFTGVALSATASSEGSTTRLVPVDTGTAVAPTTSAQVPAQTTATMSGLVVAAATALVDPTSGGSPAAPVDSPLSWALLALSRQRNPLSAAASGANQVTSSALVSSNALPVNQTLSPAIDGIITGDPGIGLPAGTYTYTVASAPSAGGKITFLPTSTTGGFTYLPDVSVLTSGTETFGIRVSQVTQFDQFLTGIPILGLVASPVIGILQQLPILSNLFAPIIGQSTVAAYIANPSALNVSGNPLAFTAKITSFDGVLISTNFFPASTVGPDAVPPGTAAPTVLSAPGLGAPGETNPFEIWSSAVVGHTVPGLGPVRDQGYNVITWDPRGTFASGGVWQADSPAFEGQDVKSIISWATGDNIAGVDNPFAGKVETVAGDPTIGFIGGSYGGAIQLTSAGIDPRIDAIVPAIAWNSLPAGLYPDRAFKTAYATLLLLSLVTTGSRVNNQVYIGIATGDLLGWLSQTSLAVLVNSGPDYLLDNVKAPTLLIQGTSDPLFPLSQALINAQQLTGLAPDQVKMVWYCGGHGACLNPPSAIQDQIIQADTFAWLDQYVMGAPVNNIPKFQWVDQDGNFYYSSKLPTDAGFNDLTPITATAAGGRLGIVPVLGGSGPSPKVPLPYNLALANPARNAIDVPISTPTITPDYIAGAPTLTFDYTGLGTARFVYAQIVDNNTGLVVGNIVTPIPVSLDGRSHQITVPVPLNDVAYTYGPSDSLSLQITSSATQFENFTAFGAVNISNVKLSIPTVDPANVNPETTPIV